MRLGWAWDKRKQKQNEKKTKNNAETPKINWKQRWRQHLPIKTRRLLKRFEVDSEVVWRPWLKPMTISLNKFVQWYWKVFSCNFGKYKVRCLYYFHFYEIQTTVYSSHSLYACIYHHHHHVVPQARISLTLSRHFSLSFIASSRSLGLNPVSSHSCCMYVLAGRPALARPYVGVHRSISLMSLSLLLQQCPACLRLRPLDFMEFFAKQHLSSS